LAFYLNVARQQAGFGVYRPGLSLSKWKHLLNSTQVFIAHHHSSTGVTLHLGRFASHLVTALCAGTFETAFAGGTKSLRGAAVRL
jgi:hypothetical protein